MALVMPKHGAFFTPVYVIMENRDGEDLVLVQTRPSN